VKLVHLVGFITKKFVRMHGHMNVKFVGTGFGVINRTEFSVPFCCGRVETL